MAEFEHLPIDPDILTINLNAAMGRIGNLYELGLESLVEFHVRRHFAIQQLVEATKSSILRWADNPEGLEHIQIFAANMTLYPDLLPAQGNLSMPPPLDGSTPIEVGLWYHDGHTKEVQINVKTKDDEFVDKITHRPEVTHSVDANGDPWWNDLTRIARLSQIINVFYSQTGNYRKDIIRNHPDSRLISIRFIRAEEG